MNMSSLHMNGKNQNTGSDACLEITVSTELSIQPKTAGLFSASPPNLPFPLDYARVGIIFSGVEKMEEFFLHNNI